MHICLSICWIRIQTKRNTFCKFIDPGWIKKADSVNKKVITLSGFKPDNKLSKKGLINFYLDADSYGIVECYHQTILHIILDCIHEGHQ